MNIEACFINTEDRPISVKRLKIFEYMTINEEIRFFEWCEYTYPHPDAPEIATVKIKTTEEVKCPTYFVSSAKLVIDAMKGLAEVLK